ncbi:hypothetical protein SDC9_189858 [bioreactor metagenome]|uniref:Uncharacterized protein n=1 Tax=bioreactor metagenome TaxID=1076179 RepID=A0A645HTC8_9ZZZZ
MQGVFQPALEGGVIQREVDAEQEHEHGDHDLDIIAAISGNA